MQNDRGTIIQYQLKTLKFVLIIYSISAFLATSLFAFMKLIGFYAEIRVFYQGSDYKNCSY